MITYINDLKSDGIIQNAHEGISVRFAHDIFFEWSFFYVLIDSENQWISEIKASGEPPALARAGRRLRSSPTASRPCASHSLRLRAPEPQHRRSPRSRSRQ